MFWNKTNMNTYLYNNVETKLIYRYDGSPTLNLLALYAFITSVAVDALLEIDKKLYDYLIYDLEINFITFKYT